ncbi:hypothetical protein PG985_004489 [Apiospora marii]|uniref:uncharacterized protein n=1 Tax=Apiospora marii TaxID=335849 RepID=UPI00312F3BBD
MGLSITLPLIYTHGGAYAILDAFLDADPGHKKYLCICLQSSHLSSAVFSRSISVRKPLEIDTESLGDLRRYNIMVPYKAGYTRDAHSSEGKIGLILVLKETATQFFSAQPEPSNTSCFHSNQPLVTNLKQYYTSPIFLFDSRNGLLTLSPPQHCGSIDPLHTALMYIETKSEGQHGQSEAYYLFFGAMMREESVTWYCDMTTRSQLTKQKLTQLMMSQADLEEHFRKKAMAELGSMRQRTHATSEDLQIDIGSSVYLSPEMVTRTAILSGPSPGSRTRRRRHGAVWKFLSSFRLPVGSSPTSAAIGGNESK